MEAVMMLEHHFNHSAKSARTGQCRGWSTSSTSPFLTFWSTDHLPQHSHQKHDLPYQHFKGHLLHLNLCKYFQCTLEKKTVKKVSPDTSCRKIPRYQIPIQQNTKVLTWQSRVEKYFGLLSRYFSRRRVGSKCWFSNIYYHYLCTWINFSERYARPRIVKFVQQRRYSPVFKYSSIQQFSNIQVFKTKCHHRFAETSNRTWSRTSRRRIAISSHKRIVGWRPSLFRGHISKSQLYYYFGKLFVSSSSSSFHVQTSSKLLTNCQNLQVGVETKLHQGSKRDLCGGKGQP